MNINKINFKEFKEILEKMRDLTDMHDEIDDLKRKFNNKYDEGFSYVIEPNLLSDMVFVLETMFEDKGETISYWVFEKDFGRKLKLGDVSEADGTPIPLTTIEELWEYLN